VNGFKDAEGTRSEASDTDENTKSPNSQTGRLSGGAMEVQNDKNGVEMRLHKTSRKSSGESTFLLLEHNYHILFDISYYLMVSNRLFIPTFMRSKLRYYSGIFKSLTLNEDTSMPVGLLQCESWSSRPTYGVAG